METLEDKIKENNKVLFVGFGGQGAVTAGDITLDCLFELGKYYLSGHYSPGSERRGRPVSFQAGFFEDKNETKNFEKLKEEDILFVFSENLLNTQILSGLKEDGILLVNTDKTPEELCQENKIFAYYNICNIDATEIYRKAAQEFLHRIVTVGEVRPNVPMVSAFFKATNIIGLKDLLNNMEKKWKGEAYNINKRAAELSYECVKILRSSKKGLNKDEVFQKQKILSMYEIEETAVSMPSIGPSGKTGIWAIEQPIINEKYCTKCGACFLQCPDGTIEFDLISYPKVNYDYCKGCGICAYECTKGAIRMEKRK